MERSGIALAPAVAQGLGPQIPSASLVKALEMTDYAEIQAGVSCVKHAVRYFTGRGVRLDVTHDHRYWEYGTALQLMFDNYKEDSDGCRLLDVGSGWSPLGPALSLFGSAQVTECEPDIGCLKSRILVNQILKKLGRPELDCQPRGVGNLPAEEYDTVFCISVLEHVDRREEQQAWRELARRVRKHGFLFVTVDCVLTDTGRYQWDEYRRTRYTMELLKQRVDLLMSLGFVPLGKPDFEWKAAQVWDYNFFRIGMMRE